MDRHDLPAFLAGLNEMSALFCDELSEIRQRLYWQFFQEIVSLEEWQAACHQAMTGETFYKVPLPAVLMEYVRDYRKHQRCQQARTTAPPLRQLREDLVAQAEVQALIASIWPEQPPKDNSMAS